MKISIITPSYNTEQYIERAIKSVISQNYKDFEHIIIDGKSSDNTIKILEKHHHLKWISEKDSGQSEAMNKGFMMSTGDIIAYLNADDYFLPNTFHTISETIKKGAEIVLGNLLVIPNTGSKWIHKPSTDYMDILMHWKGLFPLNPVQYFIRRSLHEGISYNVDNHLSMDHEFLLQIFQKATPELLDIVFGVFDMVDGSKTAESIKKPREYWSSNNFSHIDHFLEYLPPKHIIEFKNQQCDFFHAQHLKHNLAGFAAMKREIDRYDALVIYGAGTLYNVFNELFTDKISHVIDLNPLLQKTFINGHEILPLSALLKMKNPTIIITALGHRDTIAEALKPIKNAKLIFIEDFFC